MPPDRTRRVLHAVIADPADLEGLAERLERRHYDLVELDVMPRDGGLIVAHDSRDLARPDRVPFEDALRALGEHLHPDAGIVVDLKGIGYEREVVAAIERTGVGERVLLATMHLDSLRRARALAPDLRRAWSVPLAQRDYLARPALRPLVLAGLTYYRRILPAMVARALASGDAQVLMAHWGVVSRRLCAEVARHRGELYVWTVDDVARLRRVERFAPTGVVTNDLALFD